MRTFILNHYARQAVKTNQTQCLSTILSHAGSRGVLDAAVNTANNKGSTPLHCAWHKFQLDHVKLLIQNGADSKLTTHRKQKRPRIRPHGSQRASRGSPARDSQVSRRSTSSQCTSTLPTRQNTPPLCFRCAWGLLRRRCLTRRGFVAGRTNASRACSSACRSPGTPGTGNAWLSAT